MCKELEDFWEEVLEEDRKKTRAEGRIEERFLSVKRIMKNLHCTLDEAMQALEIPAEDRDTYIAII